MSGFKSLEFLDDKGFGGSKATFRFSLSFEVCCEFRPSNFEFPYGPTNSTRKPIVFTAVEGTALFRFAERHNAPVAFKAPPRNTRWVPVDGPVGFVTGVAAYTSYQSCTHSHTFPAMSYKPRAFAE